MPSSATGAEVSVASVLRQPQLSMDLRALSVVPPQGGYVAKTCPRRAHLDHDSNYAGAELLDESAGARMRMDEGIDFEAEVGKQLRSVLCEQILTGAAVFLEGDRTGESLEARQRATQDAMDRGVVFIWNPRFDPQRDVSRTGEPDALVRYGQAPKPNGKWAYIPIDVKHHMVLSGTRAASEWEVSHLSDPRYEGHQALLASGSPQLVDSMQLAHYFRMLEHSGHAADLTLGGIIGKPLAGPGGESALVVLWRDLSTAAYLHEDAAGERHKMSALDIYDAEFAWRLKVIARALECSAVPGTEALVWPERKDECSECPWRQVCTDELADADHITLLYGVTPSRAKAHYSVGISTIDGLARLHWPTARLIDAGLDAEGLITYRSDPRAPAMGLPELAEEFIVKKKGKATSAIVAGAIDAMMEVGISSISDRPKRQTACRWCGRSPHGALSGASPRGI